MGDGNGERVSFVGGRVAALGQQQFDHVEHLAFFGVTGTDNRLLDLVGCVFCNSQSRLRRNEQRDGTRLPKLQRRDRILVDEGVLDGSFGRPVRGKHGGQSVMQILEAQCEVVLTAGRDGAVRNVLQAISVRLHDTPSGAAEAGIETDDPNREHPLL